MGRHGGDFVVGSMRRYLCCIARPDVEVLKRYEFREGPRFLLDLMKAKVC